LGGSVTKYKRLSVTRISFTAREIESTSDCLSNAPHFNKTAARKSQSVQPVKIHKDQGSCQLEDEKIQSQIAPQESQSLSYQYVVVPSQLVTDLLVQLITKQVEAGFEEHIQIEKIDVHKAQDLVGEFQGGDQYGGKYSSEETRKEEVPANYKD
jgi:hypothetical protein